MNLMVGEKIFFSIFGIYYSLLHVEKFIKLFLLHTYFIWLQIDQYGFAKKKLHVKYVCMVMLFNTLCDKNNDISWGNKGIKKASNQQPVIFLTIRTQISLKGIRLGVKLFLMLKNTGQMPLKIQINQPNFKLVSCSFKVLLHLVARHLLSDKKGPD